MAVNLNKRRDQQERFSEAQIDENWDWIEAAINAQEPNPDDATIENEYDTISGIGQLLADQENQTQGNIQFVANASDDPGIESGYAYYEKLASDTGQLADYRRLSAQEATTIQGSSQKVEDSTGTAFSTALKILYGEGFRVSILPTGGYKLMTDSLNTEDTGTNIELRIFGGICNAASPNTNNAFTVTGTGFRRVHISTAGKEDFPTIAGAVLRPGAEFETDTTFDMWVDNTTGTLEYFFTSR